MRSTFSIALAALTVAAAVSAQDPVKQDTKAMTAELNAAFQAQDWKKTVDLGRKVTTGDPKNGFAWHQLGYARHVQGMLDEAIVAHKAAAEFPKTKAHALYNLACAYGLKKDANQACDALEKSVVAGFADLATLEQDADLASVREEPRYKKVVEDLKKAPKKVRAYYNPGDRKSVRVAFFTQTAAPQAVLSYGVPVWKNEYQKVVEAGKVDGKRWRLGIDAWTTLDTSAEMTIGGKTLAPGLYYLTLERSVKGEYTLAFNDAAEVRKLRLDAFQCAQTKGGVEVAMTASKADRTAEALVIDLEVNEADQASGELSIAFGPYRLAVPYTIKVAN